MCLILVDFDRTLYDVNAMKGEWEKILESEGINANIFFEFYEDVKKHTGGYLDPQDLYRRLDAHTNGWGNIAERLIKSYPYGNHLMQNTHQALELLRRLGTIVIWSLGEENYQRLKIESCGLDVDKVCVSTSKPGDYHEILRGYEDRKIIVIDDNPKYYRECLKRQQKF